MAKRFSGYEFAWGANVGRCSFFVRTVIAASVIAAPLAETKLAGASGVVPTAGTNRVRKAGSIIATARGNTGSAGPKRA